MITLLWMTANRKGRYLFIGVCPYCDGESSLMLFAENQSTLRCPECRALVTLYPLAKKKGEVWTWPTNKDCFGKAERGESTIDE